MIKTQAERVAEIQLWFGSQIPYTGEPDFVTPSERRANEGRRYVGELLKMVDVGTMGKIQRFIFDLMKLVFIGFWFFIAGFLYCLMGVASG